MSRGNLIYNKLYSLHHNITVSKIKTSIYATEKFSLPKLIPSFDRREVNSQFKKLWKRGSKVLKEGRFVFCIKLDHLAKSWILHQNHVTVRPNHTIILVTRAKRQIQIIKTLLTHLGNIMSLPVLSSNWSGPSQGFPLWLILGDHLSSTNRRKYSLLNVFSANVQGPQYPLASVWQRPRAWAPKSATISLSENPIPFQSNWSRILCWYCFNLISWWSNFDAIYDFFEKHITHGRIHPGRVVWYRDANPCQHREVHTLLGMSRHSQRLLGPSEMESLGPCDI